MPGRRRLIGLAALAGGLVLAVGGPVAVILSHKHSAGMGAAASRDPADDPRLVAIAREADPMIAAVETFYARHGACPRPDRPHELAEFSASVGNGIVAERHRRFVEFQLPGRPLGWLYDVSDRDAGSCKLWRKLGWDPALTWRRDRGGARWMFDPGDGSEARAIAIEPHGR